MAFLAKDVELRSKKHGFVGRGISIQIKTNSFKVTQKSKKMATFTNDSKTLLAYAQELFAKYKVTETIRLLGIRLDDLEKEEKIKKNNIFSYFKKVEQAKSNGRVTDLEIVDEVGNGQEAANIRAIDKNFRMEKMMAEVEEILEEDLDRIETED